MFSPHRLQMPLILRFASSIGHFDVIVVWQFFRVVTFVWRTQTTFVYYKKGGTAPDVSVFFFGWTPRRARKSNIVIMHWDRCFWLMDVLILMLTRHQCCYPMYCRFSETTHESRQLPASMEEGKSMRSGKKCAAVPPIMIQSETPRPPRSPRGALKTQTNPGSDKRLESQYLGSDDAAIAAQLATPVSTSNCKLPLINPQGGIFSSCQTLNQPLLSNGSSRPGDPLFVQYQSPLKYLSDVKPEPHSFAACTGHFHHATVAGNQPSSMQHELPNSLYLPKTLKYPNKLSPLSISASVTSGGIHQLQLPNGAAIPGHMATPNALQAQSPAFSDISSIRFTPQSPFLHGFPAGEGQLKHAPRTKLKSETAYSAKTHLPPLSAAGYTSNGSNTDIEDAASPLIPPLHSFSPYLGSGISEVPSFPSLLSPSSPIHHLSRKRALSISPNNSDMLDCIRSSPNSLITTLHCNNAGSDPTPTNSGGSVGHLVGNLSPAGPHLQYRLQQRRVSVEHNQNSDGTTNMTITNQLTFSEHLEKNRRKFNAKSGDQSNLAVQQQLQHEDQQLQATEPMDFDAHSVKSSVTSTSSHLSHSQTKEELNDPHICLWEGCGQSCDQLEDLVQHIENAHIEKGKSEDFTCLWQSCIRRRKPFNARYKLLIHMRIHSGEKPNKCTVSC